MRCVARPKRKTRLSSRHWCINKDQHDRERLGRPTLKAMMHHLNALAESDTRHKQEAESMDKVEIRMRVVDGDLHLIERKAH